MHVGLIGPVLPFRGGIAQHTTMLHRSLSRKVSLCTVSFRRQYPRYLYPGKSDRDPEYVGHAEKGVQYVIDSFNPVTWIKACRILTGCSPKLVIIIWCTFFGAPYLGFMARYFRKRGVQVMFLCHNVIDHEAASWKVKISRMALSQGSIFCVHANRERERLGRLVPGAQVMVHPHPIYDHFPPAKANLRRRAKLELLFFGFVRRYKGLDVLVEALSLLKEEDIFLSVVGEWWERDAALLNILKNARLQSRVEIVDRYVSGDEAANYFSRADVVVLPYRSATGTGIIPLAYHYGKPVIAARTGGIPEVVMDGVSGRLFEPENPRALAEVIREFLHTEPDRMRGGVQRVAEHMTWDSLAECVLKAISKENDSRSATAMT